MYVNGNIFKGTRGRFPCVSCRNTLGKVSIHEHRNSWSERIAFGANIILVNGYANGRQMLLQPGKPTMIFFKSVCGTGDSWHHGGTIETFEQHPRTSQHYSIEVCPSIGHPLCRETSVSRTAAVSFFQSGETFKRHAFKNLVASRNRI